MFVTERAAGRPGLLLHSFAAEEVYCGGGGADVSVCQRPNSLPCGSLQAENQPMPGTGMGWFASPPSSLTRAAPALMSSTSKYGRMPFLPGSMSVTAAPVWSEMRVMWYSLGPGKDSNCHPNRDPQNSFPAAGSSAGISMCTIAPAIGPPL